MTENEADRRMRAIAGGLQAAGLSAQLHDTKGVLDLTATVHRPGGKETDVRALATITAGQRS